MYRGLRWGRRRVDRVLGVHLGVHLDVQLSGQLGGRRGQDSNIQPGGRLGEWLGR
jgi:hypothetical protein